MPNYSLNIPSVWAGIRGSALSLTLVASLYAVAPTGEQIYRQACASCHESGQNRAPSYDALRQLSADAIRVSLESGTMAAVGATLPEGYAQTVAYFLGKTSVATGKRSREACPDSPALDPFAGPRWMGWGADLANSRYQRADFAGMNADSVPRLRLRWAFGVPNADRARGHPTVAGGRVYFGARNGRVYALEAKSGCTVWEFQAKSEVRTAIDVSAVADGTRFALYFGDTKANLYAVDAATGKQIWRTKVDEHAEATLTGAPVVHDGRVYAGVSSIEEFTGSFPQYECCTFRGSLVAIDAANGERIWKTYTIPEPPVPRERNRRGVMQHGPSGAGVWAAPTIDEHLGRVYVTTGDNYSDPPTDDSDAIIAFDLESGTRLWSRQFTEGDAYNIACNPRADKVNCPESNGPDFDFGASAILAALPDGKRLLIAGQKSGMVHAVDPDRNGAIVWQQRAGEGGKLGGIQFGPAADGRNVYVAISDYRGPAANKGGGLTAFRLEDGERQWHVPGFPCPSDRKGCSPAQSAAVTAIPGVVFSGALDGFLRAYSADDGSVLWSYDTIRAYPQSVNGVQAKGGSINGPGPAVADGMLFVNSGYGQFGSIPGNAILAFDLDDDPSGR